MEWKGGVTVKSKEDQAKMRQAGRVVAGLLQLMRKEVKAGVSTQGLDEIAEAFIRSEGAEAAFKGYHEYPASICVSVNEVVIHGVPGSRVLKEGDIAGIDVGVRFQGFYADAARTFPVGKVDAESRRLIEVTAEALRLGINQAVAGNRIGDISWAVQSYAEAQGLSVVREYVGHGIGRSLHEEPQVPNYGKPHQGVQLLEGMTLAIEPMLNSGRPEIQLLNDGWTVVTQDRRRSGHFVQTVIIGKDKAEIITN